MFCVQCGVKVEENYKFCQSCGTNLNDEVHTAIYSKEVNSYQENIVFQSKIRVSMLLFFIISLCIYATYDSFTWEPYQPSVGVISTHTRYLYDYLGNWMMPYLFFITGPATIWLIIVFVKYIYNPSVPLFIMNNKELKAFFGQTSFLKLKKPYVINWNDIQEASIIKENHSKFLKIITPTIDYKICLTGLKMSLEELSVILQKYGVLVDY